MTTSQKQIYKISAIGMFAIFAMLITPGSILEAESTKTGLSVYGMIDLVQKDSSGNVIQTQTIHNAITDEGENWLIDQVFDTSATAATNRIGSICITDITLTTQPDHEGATAASVSDANNGLGTTAHCIVDAEVDSTLASTGVVGPLTFTGGTHLGDGETINSIAICSGNGAAADSTFEDCNDADPSVAFAVRAVNPVTLAADDTVEVTYTFDVVSDTETI